MIMPVVRINTGRSKNIVFHDMVIGTICHSRISNAKTLLQFVVNTLYLWCFNHDDLTMNHKNSVINQS